jgi:hypothetical protein
MSEELKQAAQELGGVPTEKHLTQKQGVDAILNLHKANDENTSYAMLGFTFHGEYAEDMFDKIVEFMVYANEKGWSEFRPNLTEVVFGKVFNDVAKDDYPQVDDEPAEEASTRRVFPVQAVSHDVTKSNKDCIKLWNKDAWFSTYGLTVMDWVIPSAYKSAYKDWELGKKLKAPPEMAFVITEKKQGSKYENAIGFMSEEQYLATQ